MSTLRIALRVGEILSATVRRKITTNRILICLKGYSLVAEPEYDVAVGEEIRVQVLTTFPRIRLRVIPSATARAATPQTGYPRELRT